MPATNRAITLENFLDHLPYITKQAGKRVFCKSISFMGIDAANQKIKVSVDGNEKGEAEVNSAASLSIEEEITEKSKWEIECSNETGEFKKGVWMIAELTVG